MFANNSDLPRLNRTLWDDPLYQEMWYRIQWNLLELTYMSPKQQMQIFNDPEGRFLLDKEQIQENPSMALYELMSVMIDEDNDLPY